MRPVLLHTAAYRIALHKLVTDSLNTLHQDHVDDTVQDAYAQLERKTLRERFSIWREQIKARKNAEKKVETMLDASVSVVARVVDAAYDRRIEDEKAQAASRKAAKKAAQTAAKAATVTPPPQAAAA